MEKHVVEKQGNQEKIISKWMRKIAMECSLYLWFYFNFFLHTFQHICIKESCHTDVILFASHLKHLHIFASHTYTIIYIKQHYHIFIFIFIFKFLFHLPQTFKHSDSSEQKITKTKRKKKQFHLKPGKIYCK